MKCIVTGGAGFIGAHVAHHLAQRGDVPILYDANPHQGILERVIPEGIRETLRSEQGSVNDLPRLMSLASSEGVDAIVHLAALQIPASQANPWIAVQVNCDGMTNILELAKLLHIRRVVWASSIAVFGPRGEHAEGPIANDACQRPNTVYGGCKSLCEVLARHYYETRGVDSIGFRFTGVYGLGRNRGKTSFTTVMVEKAVRGEPYTVPFATDLYDWQYVDDVAEVILKALDAPSTMTRVFNTQGDVRPVYEGVEYLKTLVPEAELSTEPGEVGIAWEYDTAPLREELGFVPRHTMEMGILKTLNAIRGEEGLPPIETPVGGSNGGGEATK